MRHLVPSLRPPLLVAVLAVLVLALAWPMAPRADAQPGTSDAPAVSAEASASETPNVVGNALDRLLVALGVLLVLAQATERMIVTLRGKEDASRAEGADEQPVPQRVRVRWAPAVGVVLAIVCGVNIVDVLNTGAVRSCWEKWPPQVPPAWWLGMLVTGLFASMGSGFLEQVIKLLQELRKTQAEVTGTRRAQRDHAKVRAAEACVRYARARGVSTAVRPGQSVKPAGLIKDADELAGIT